MIKCNIMFNHNQICLELVAAASMTLIGQSRVLSTALPRNKNLPHTCWMNCLALSSNKGTFEWCVAYCFLAPYWMGTHGYGAYCHFWQCVGIVLMILSRSLALTNVPGILCSSNLMWWRCIVFLSNHKRVCNFLLEPVWDEWHVPRQRIVLESCQQPMWIVLALCRVSKGRVPICSVDICVCVCVLWG